MKTGITGATGQLGRLVVEKLKERTAAENIVALVRTPAKAADLGIEARSFDYDQAETLKDSLVGIDQLLLISGNEIGQRATQHENIITAAKAAGVKHIVYTSLLRADTSTLSLAAEHVATEQVLKDAGIAYTILRNGWYTENYTGSVAGAVAAGAFIGSAGNGKIASAARVDYAEAAAIVLTSEDQAGKVYELAGDKAYTLTEFAAELSAQVGKEIPYNDLSENEYAEVLSQLGVPKEFAQAIAGWDVSASQGDLFDDGGKLSSLLGRATTPLAETIKEALQTS
ncbi:SDR family oxidoreductase [Sphingobacterium oryzagri]|uniref:SDR family oxidoreductase n=1 Tax=Sphingobacterium oryzagri TaxID=3025669 RepID=A0ABY7WD99_9SPHI|nr:SDR family oxidoreductase [Sphingobacterium sp. KACC 22765]WDF67472.1 SDR family oxidoreductase [Sphingobacterium sp. KACC 22765]